MSLHRSCCPCGDCYDGVLCEPCMAPCADVAQPPTTIQISSREWLNNIDSLPGTGAGAVVYVNGAWYFFDGSTSACVSRASTIDWAISFRSDGCPDFSVSLDITVPFVGGFSWGEGWTVSASCGGIDSPTECAALSFDPIGAPDLVSATDPALHGWTVTFSVNYMSAYEQFYGAATYAVSHGGDMTPCVGLEDVATGYTGTCNVSWHDSVTTIEGQMGAEEVSGDWIAGTAIRFTRTCSSGTYSVELTNTDSDGFFVCKVNTTCVIRFIGPVARFVAAFNAVFAGAGISCESLDDDWFLGCKVRPGYEGTVDQPTFPALVSVSPTVFSLSTLGATQDIEVADRVYGVPNTSCLTSDYSIMDARAVSFYGKSSLSYDDPGFDTDVCPSCGGPTDGLGGYTGFVPSHWSQETSTGSGNSGVVRERYGVSLRPRDFVWTECPPGLGPCALVGVTWVVT